MRLSITGLGVVSPFGVGIDPWEAALGEPAAGRERAFGASKVVEGARTAEVWGFNAKKVLGPKGHRTFDRLTKYLIAAAKQSLEHAGIKQAGEFLGPLTPERLGICSATAYGSLDAITELNRVAELEAPRYINPSRFPNTVINAAAGYVSIWEDLRAPNATIVDGNCGALDAILTAATHLEHGRADAFLVGGGEVVSEPLYRAFARLGVIAGVGGDADRPSSQGVEMGEGASYVVAERPADAVARGARVLGEIVGYGTAFEPPASEALLVHASADATERAVAQAIEDAGLEASAIDLVISARCGLPEMDAAEARGLRAVFGREVATCALKRLHGETFGAAGAFGVAAACAWFGGVPVTTPLLSGELPRDEVEHLVISTVGFYGNCSAVVLRRPG